MPGVGPERARVAVHVTGMSGTGKTTALAGLAARGHRTVDTDDGGWMVTRDAPDGSGPEEVWNEAVIHALLDGHREGTLFVQGTVSNQGLFRSRFDAVVVLTAPLDVILDRVARRTSNPYGSTAADRDLIAEHVATVEPLLLASATHVVDAQQPPDAVVVELERIAAAVR